MSPCRKTDQQVAIGIVIVAHGGLAAEYLSVRALASRPEFTPLPLLRNDDRSLKQQDRSYDAADSGVDTGDGVVIDTDLLVGRRPTCRYGPVASRTVAFFVWLRNLRCS
jgi:hypothetical protein